MLTEKKSANGEIFGRTAGRSWICSTTTNRYEVSPRKGWIGLAFVCCTITSSPNLLEKPTRKFPGIKIRCFGRLTFLAVQHGRRWKMLELQEVVLRSSMLRILRDVNNLLISWLKSGGNLVTKLSECCFLSKLAQRFFYTV